MYLQIPAIFMELLEIFLNPDVQLQYLFEHEELKYIPNQFVFDGENGYQCSISQITPKAQVDRVKKSSFFSL